MNNLKNIKNIIFDLGGVVLDIDANRLYEAFKRLCSEDYEKVASFIQSNETFNNFEKGLVSSNQFRDSIIQLCNCKIDYEQFDEAWNAILIDFKQERLEIIKHLKLQYNTFLLSNTNEIHYQTYTKWLNVKYHSNWEDLFNIAWFSHQINEQKPDVRIFKKVLALGHLRPEETLFIDDLQENLNSAKSLGIKTQLVSKDYTITDIFSPNSK